MTVCSEGDGRYALTHWRVVQNYHNRFSAIELSLQTGRTHQIRVHMAHIGRPLVGDVLYGTGLENQIAAFENGQVLQAFRLTFTHPITGATHCFELPPDEKYERALGYIFTL
jgi:23S rRNA pseudouridine1911/1915/1917 synthase